MFLFWTISERCDQGIISFFLLELRRQNKGDDCTVKVTGREHARNRAEQYIQQQDATDVTHEKDHLIKKAADHIFSPGHFPVLFSSTYVVVISSYICGSFLIFKSSCGRIACDVRRSQLWPYLFFSIAASAIRGLWATLDLNGASWRCIVPWKTKEGRRIELDALTHCVRLFFVVYFHCDRG